MITLNNFDWNKTNTELIFLIPNFGRGRYIRKILPSLINTSISRDKWKILIINDSIHEDFSDLEDKNVLYFTLERSPCWERGDAFTRNIAIKYCQSKMLAQKDPETIATNDFIKGCFLHQDVLYRCGNYAYQAGELETSKYLNNEIDIEKIIEKSNKFPITEYFVYWHYMHCAPIKYFKNLNGYDEEFMFYGWADKHMHDRLIKSGLKQYVDKDCSVIHLHHNKPDVRNNEKDKENEKINRQLYEIKTSQDIVVNKNILWGEGGI